jgi:hypothetical protein
MVNGKIWHINVHGAVILNGIGGLFNIRDPQTVDASMREEVLSQRYKGIGVETNL